MRRSLRVGSRVMDEVPLKRRKIRATHSSSQVHDKVDVPGNSVSIPSNPISTFVPDECKPIEETPTKKKTFRKPVVFKPPENWSSDLEMMRFIRSARNAPVDSMGAEALGDRNGEFEFHILIALMLSSQTKDQVVAEAMNKLHVHGLTLKNIHDTTSEDLNEIIKSVGFHNNKTKYIKETVRIILEERDGKVPDALDGLLSLPGIGPKMAILILNCAFDKPYEGIAIDTHVHRFCNILKWAKASSPEGTRVQLESWLPKEHWKDINLIMVGIGQMIQQPLSRDKMIELCTSWEEDKKNKAFKLLRKLGLKHF